MKQWGGHSQPQSASEASQGHRQAGGMHDGEEGGGASSSGLLWSTFRQGVAGTCAGLAECLSSYPLDSIKTRLQTSDRYVGTYDCFKVTVAEEGFRALYRGMSSRLTACAVQSTFMFSANSAMRDLVGADSKQPLSARFALAAIMTGCCEAFVYTPFELLKVRSQTAQPGMPSTPIACAREIVGSYGLTGLFWGLKPTLMRESAGNFIYFTSYYAFRQKLVDEQVLNISHTAGVAISGGLAGVSFWGSIHPFDTVKSLVTSDSVKTPKYSGAMDAARKLLAEKGIKGMYRGMAPSLIRAFIGNAFQFVVYERVLEEIPP